MSHPSAQAELSARVPALLGGNRIVPVIEIDDPDDAVPLTRALAAGGITIVEITIRTPAGVAAVRAAAAATTGSVVGAGTILTPADVDAAVEAGAAFGVSPGWDPLTASRAVERPTPSCTASVVSPGSFAPSSHSPARMRARSTSAA